MLTVEELILKLQKIEDKSMQVSVHASNQLIACSKPEDKTIKVIWVSKI